jgi:hypothetical protein
MGFTRDQIIELFADIFERFNFDRRENEMAGMRAKVSAIE